MNMRTPPSLLDEEQGDSQPENIAQIIEVDFSEYMWMGEELEEFDRQVEEELLEQAFIEACFEDMLEEEEIHWYYSQQGPQTSIASPLPATLHSHIPPGTHRDVMECRKDDMLRSSTLNPEAPEFVPKTSLVKQ